MKLLTPEENQERYAQVKVEGQGHKGRGASQPLQQPAQRSSPPPPATTEEHARSRPSGTAKDRSRSRSRSIEEGSGSGPQFLKTPLLRTLQDSESESVVSDCSELCGPLKELEREVEVVDREELRNYSNPFYHDPCGTEVLSVSIASSVGAEDFERREGETEAEYSRRVRKLNLLSLAQEFAELKRLNADVCPIDFHLSQKGKSSMTSSALSLGSAGQREKMDTRMTSSAVVLGSHVSSLANGGGGLVRDANDITNCANEGSSHGQSGAGLPQTLSSEETGQKDSSSARNLLPPAGEEKEKFSNAGQLGEDFVDAPSGSSQKKKVMPGKSDTMDMDPSSHGHSAASIGQEGGEQCEDREGREEREGDFEVWTMDSSVPTLNWTILEQQLQLAADLDQRNKEARQTEREEIRRRLAMGGDEDYYGGERVLKKPSLSSRLQAATSLQLCYLNEAALPDEGDVTSSSPPAAASSATSSQSHHNLSAVTSSDATVTSASSSTSSSSSSVTPRNNPSVLQSSKCRPKSDPGLLASQMSLPPSDESLAQRQQRLQREATMALAQASNMARMQLEVERKTKKKSPIADIVGVPELGRGRRMKISHKLLYEMNLAQLQVLVNDLHSQIESLNEDLVHLLMERDDLHMEQDSMLVDIEDLTSFAQHMSETNNNKTTQNNRNSASASVLSKRLK